jgi:Zn finger protein HypA/HybF involved in hydrogenase expression
VVEYKWKQKHDPKKEVVFMATQKPAYLIEKKVLHCKCQRCGNEWIPKVESKWSLKTTEELALPVKCPQCQSRNWHGNSPEGE